jgi:hypothetical protein
VQDSGFSPQELQKFTAAGRTIASAVGTSVELWAYAEMGVVLKTWAGRTKVRKPRALEVSALMRIYRIARRVAGMENLKSKGSVRPGQAGINLGIRSGNFGKVYYRTRKAGAAMGKKGMQDVYGPNFSGGKHIAPRDWGVVSGMVSNFRAHYRAGIKAAQGAGGLSRQAILQIADSLGIRLEAVKGGGTLSGAGLTKARRAMPSTGRTYRNGTGVRKRGVNSYVEAVLRYPLAQKLGMGITLGQIIRGRLAFFQRNLQEGVFLSARHSARAYPYLAVLKAS